MNIQWNFNPVGNEEIIQNVNVILSTPVGTIPFDRDLGISMAYLDKPITIQAKHDMTIEYITKVRKYEPRAKVETVTFTADPENGKLTPKVVIGLA